MRIHRPPVIPCPPGELYNEGTFHNTCRRRPCGTGHHRLVGECMSFQILLRDRWRLPVCHQGSNGVPSWWSIRCIYHRTLDYGTELWWPRCAIRRVRMGTRRFYFRLGTCGVRGFCWPFSFSRSIGILVFLSTFSGILQRSSSDLAPFSGDFVTSSDRVSRFSDVSAAFSDSFGRISGFSV